MPTWPPSKLSIWPPADLATWPPTYLPAYRSAYLATWPPVYLATWPPGHLPTCPLAYLNTWLPGHMATWSHIHLPNCPPAHLVSWPFNHLPTWQVPSAVCQGRPAWSLGTWGCWPANQGWSRGLGGGVYSSAHCKLYTVYCTLSTAHSTIKITKTDVVHWKLQSIFFTMHTAHFKLHAAHSTYVQPEGEWRRPCPGPDQETVGVTHWTVPAGWCRMFWHSLIKRVCQLRQCNVWHCQNISSCESNSHHAIHDVYFRIHES